MNHQHDTYEYGDFNKFSDIPNFVPEDQRIVENFTEQQIPEPQERNANEHLFGDVRPDDTVDPEQHHGEQSDDVETAFEDKPNEGVVSIDKETLAALLKVADLINQKRPEFTPEELERLKQEELARIRAAYQGVDHNAANGGRSVGNGAVSLVDGVMSLAGATLAAGGKAAKTMASFITNDDQVNEPEYPESFTNYIDKMPRLSEYRVAQAEKNANEYQEALEKFWQSGGMSNIREQVNELSRKTGVSVQDVTQKMKPGGDYEELHRAFVDEVLKSPDAQKQKKAMDVALERWVRQYGRGQEELQNPETKESPLIDSMRQRLERTKETMMSNVGQTPGTGDHSPLEVFRDALRKIVQNIKEMAGNVMGAKRTSEVHSDESPSP